MEKTKKSASGPRCSNCEMSQPFDVNPLMKCARCQLVEYCSRECQVQHWKIGGHKLNCFTPQERSVKSSRERSLSVVDENAQVCPFCRDPFSSDSPMVALPCSHVCHRVCLQSLLSFGGGRKCPLCRTELPPGNVSSWESTCVNCRAARSADGTALLKCSHCKSVSYCGHTCQREHWKHSHKALCRLFSSKVIF